MQKRRNFYIAIISSSEFGMWTYGPEPLQIALMAMLYPSVYVKGHAYPNCDRSYNEQERRYSELQNFNSKYFHIPIAKFNSSNSRSASFREISASHP